MADREISTEVARALRDAREGARVAAPGKRRETRAERIARLRRRRLARERRDENENTTEET